MTTSAACGCRPIACSTEQHSLSPAHLYAMWLPWIHCSHLPTAEELWSTKICWLLRCPELANRQDLSPLQWEQFVDQQLSAASYSLRAYLKSPQSGAHDIFTWAQDGSAPPKVNAVLSRAMLLLRIASGVCALKLDQAHVTKDDLRFWWDSLGQACGYWAPGNEPDTFTDLWTDVSSTIGDIDVVLQTHGSPNTMSEIHQIVGPDVSLTQHPRALFWLLGLDR